MIPIHEWGEIDRTPYIDMRLVQGQTLHEIIAKSALDPERAVDIIRQVAAALDDAHANGLIHRDVKPQNILVRRDDFAYLVDFGIAECRGESHLTVTGYQVGSFAYMAPERLSGDQQATSSVDVYALTCVLYEALTGRQPFSGSSQQVIGGHLSMAPPRPSATRPGVPAALDNVIARGMAKHPDDRYGSPGALARAAKRALSAPASPAPADETVFAAQYAPPPGDPQYYYGQFSPPPTGPGMNAGPQYQPDDSRRYLVPSLVASAVVLVVIVIVLAIGVFTNPKSDSPAVAHPSSEPPTYQTTYQSTRETSAAPTYQTTTRSAPTTAAAVRDPEQQLRQLVTGDHALVATQIADLWVPQLSSKRPGTIDNGVTWDNAMALQEHLRLRQQYDAKLLWSGDWSTFSESNYWVTVAGITFTNPKGALMWCSRREFDRDHCIAKLVSKTHAVAGSTDYN